MMGKIAEGAWTTNRKQIIINIARYDWIVLKLKAKNRIIGVNSSPMATGTMKAGPSMPTVVIIRQVKKAASKPNPSL